MKKIVTFFKATTLLLCFLSFTAVKAQSKLACVTTSNPYIGSFTYLATGTRVTDIETSSGAKSGIPLGFTFRFGACGLTTNYTTVQVSSAGWLKFGAAVSGAKPNPASQDIFPGLWVFYSESMNGTGGTATYNTELLTSGLKVFTMEWKDWKWDSSVYGSSTINFQIKLYEGSDIIEYCYLRGSSTVVSGAKPYMIGLGKTKPPTSAVPGPCPGYDYAIIQSVPTLLTFNKAGSYGPNEFERPYDNQVLQFYQPCCGKPEAGIIAQPDSVCQGVPFVAKLSGATPAPFVAYGVRYLWQSSAAATGPWTDIGIAGTATSLSFPGIFGVDTFLRVVAFCDSSGYTDTTPVKHIELITLPYNCYCYSSATNDILNVNIGNVKLITSGNDTMINNGVGTPAFINRTTYRPYTLNTGLRPIREINRDSVYKISVMGITRDTFSFSASGVAVYIDYNNDGVYTASTELAAFQVLSGTTTNFVTNFTVPSTAVLDTVGMRVVMIKGATTSADVPPCGSYTEGETEDYLINITNPICPGPIVAGVARIADTSMCYGYTTMVWDTAHGRNMSQAHWEWEYSLDNVIWANVPASKFKDTIEPVVRQTTYYRLRTVCEFTKDTIYSNKVLIKLKEPYKCYCYSLANGGNQLDSSDISTFMIGKFVLNTGGPHLSNPIATRKRTDYTNLPAIELVAQKKYPIAVYHTLHSKVHADARISVFMDFNHNLKYDGASELIWSSTTTASNFFPHDSITIPLYVIPDVETGMRVVLNNDMGVSTPSDMGCDEFVSGEIEDYLVIFRRTSTGIGSISNIDNLQIYPNPNNGQFTISFKASKAISEASIVVTNITGQTVMTRQYQSITNGFIENIDLGKQASGVYFITLTADGQKSVNKLIVQ